MKQDIAALELLVGDRDGNHLSLRPTGRAHPEATAFWDANWLKAEVAVRAGAFQGRFEADLRADELEAFAGELAALEGAAEGAAALESAEGWVKLRLTQGRGGRLIGSCEVRDDPTGGSTLRFSLTSAPERRPAMAAALRAILAAFPVIGEPDEEGSALLATLGDGEDGAPDDA